MEKARLLTRRATTLGYKLTPAMLSHIPAKALGRPNLRNESKRHYTSDDREQSSAMCIKTNLSGLNPHVYTSGRWLRHDDQHQESRHVDFDFPALLRKAVEASPGARRVDKYDKIEGGYNRAFIVDLDNGEQVVARIPFHHSGPPMLATHSEVATIAYCRRYWRSSK
jgi:hypothetical protein